MKTTPLFLLLLFQCSLLFAQNYQQVGRRIFLAEAGATVHAMGESGLGTAMAVGEVDHNNAYSKSTTGFFSFYSEDMPTSFDVTQMDWRNGGALNDVCSDDYDGAWVVGYQVDDRGFSEGVLQHLRWDEEDKAFYPEFSRRKNFREGENETNVVFRSVYRLPDDRLIIGGSLEYDKKRGGEKIVPVLYLFAQGVLSKLDFPELAISSSASVIKLLPNSSEDEIAVIVEYLKDDGISDDRYKEFLLRINPGETVAGLDPKWEIGKDKRINCAGFSVSLTNEVIMTGTHLNPTEGAAWVGVAPMRAAAIEAPKVQSGVGNYSLGGNVLLGGQLNTISGANYNNYVYDPDYTHLEEFLYFPDQRAFKEMGIAKELGVGGDEPAFYNPDYYEDSNLNLWLFGQRPAGRSYLRPEAILYRADAATARSLAPAINPSLSIVEMVPDFGGVTKGILPAGMRGKLRVILRNTGPTLHYLKALVAVEGQARGLQFLSREPTELKRFKGIGENTDVRLSFPLETTEEVNLETGIRFVIQISQDGAILLEHEASMVTEGDKYEGYDIVIDNNFAVEGTRSDPRSSTTKKFRVSTQVTSARPLEAGDIVVKNKKIALNKGRGDNFIITERTVNGRHVYEISFDVDLDPKLNEITMEVAVAGEPSVKSGTLFVNYKASNLPTLHYIGIAPDYAGRALKEGAGRLAYNRKDVTDVAAMLMQHQGNGQQFGEVDTTLLTSAAATTSVQLREFFGVLANRVDDPTASDYIGPDDLVVLHFASHGGLRGNKYAVIPSDFDKKNSARVLNYGEVVLPELKRLNRRVVVFIDACHNPLSKEGTNSRGEDTADPKLMEKLFELHRDVKGVAVLAAASEGEKAYEHERWENGLFTEALLEALSGTTGYDADGSRINADGAFGQPDGQLSVNELSTYLSRRVPGLIRQVSGWGVQQHPKPMFDRDSDLLPGDAKLFRLPVDN